MLTPTLWAQALTLKLWHRLDYQSIAAQEGAAVPRGAVVGYEIDPVLVLDHLISSECEGVLPGWSDAGSRSGGICLLLSLAL